MTAITTETTTPILAAVDGSPESAAAVDAAIELGRELDAPVVFVSVRRGPSGALGEPFYQRRLTAEMATAVDAILPALAAAEKAGVEAASPSSRAIATPGSSSSAPAAGGSDEASRATSSARPSARSSSPAAPCPRRRDRAAAHRHADRNERRAGAHDPDHAAAPPTAPFPSRRSVRRRLAQPGRRRSLITPPRRSSPARRACHGDRARSHARPRACRSRPRRPSPPRTGTPLRPSSAPMPARRRALSALVATRT
jgi:hypothetical protein